ncbi:RNA-binding domain-containing protein [Daldinia loculata]|uniref:RNA-binding domain-containing protein n=1 Tax=Daldinia loculata TaxID=103429 RepID=UPI0020C45A8F|nr:RNA-binding domain-containing protein [Daldinia loculata]KAI1651867.1 RNA-binding domain-containing protein [Daldinia loculata]KAI2781793.1 RNA-binding domain-containing protein [Daldinia loculata]
MATTAMDYETANGDRFDDDGPRYERDQRSASPRASRDDGIETSRRRSASPAANHQDRAPKEENGNKDEDGSVNPGSNLFVTGIHPRLTEAEVTRLFEKYGEVEKCQIMKDPHTKESRGFGFVKMVTSDQADAAKDGLQGEEIEGRTLSIEKARRARPRTPTPGKYFGPPKREGRPRFDERRRGGGYGGGGGGGYGGRDDPYRYRGYDRPRYEDRGDRGDRGYREDRGYDRSYRDARGGGGYSGGREDRGYDRSYDRNYGREDRRERGGGSGAAAAAAGGSSSGGGGGGGEEGYGRIDRYAGGREERDRYGPRGGDERRGPGYERERFDRPDRDGGARARDPAASSYGESAARPEARETYGGAP